MAAKRALANKGRALLAAGTGPTVTIASRAVVADMRDETFAEKARAAEIKHSIDTLMNHASSEELRQYFSNDTDDYKDLKTKIKAAMGLVPRLPSASAWLTAQHRRSLLGPVL